MARIRFLLVLLLSVAGPAWLHAQVDADLVFIADEAYKLGDKRDANAQYRMAVGINPGNVRANYMAGITYLETIQKEKGLKYLLKAYELDPNVAPDILYSIAKAYHLGKKPEQAADYYARYRDAMQAKGGSEAAKEAAKAERRIQECAVARKLMNQPVRFKVESIKALNTVEPEYAPAISADESTMIFTSRRPGGVSPDKANDNMFYEDIYLSHRKNGEWSAPENLTAINTPSHEASIALSADGKTLLLYKDENRGDIFVSEIGKKGEWSKPKPLGGNVNSPYAERSAAISPDGQLLFFSSDRPGGQGGLDIYVSEALSKGKWGAPSNLGPTINTAEDDDSPVLAFDGKTLYFSSKGHEGMGGYDLYKSEYDSVARAWSKPANLGYPINTPDDDTYYIITADGERAYYASVKDDIGPGEMDIFMITPLPPEEEPVLAQAEEEEAAEKPTIADEQPVMLADASPRPTPMATPSVREAVRVVIKVVDAAGHALEDAQVSLQATQHRTALRLADAQYSADLHLSEPTDYTLQVSRAGYLSAQVPIRVPASGERPQEIVRQVRLTAIARGERRVLRNIYFEFDQAQLRPESEPELRQLADFLRGNPQTKVEIAGHTDRRGSRTYNLTLSQRRAEAIVQHLIGQGIGADRLRAKGYGFDKPLASNDDEQEGRELNRRTEFEVIE